MSPCAGWRHREARRGRNAHGRGQRRGGELANRLEAVVRDLARATAVVGQWVGSSRAVGTGPLSCAGGGRRQGPRNADVQPVLLLSVPAAGNRRQDTALLRAGCLQWQLGRQGRNGRNGWHWTVGGHRAVVMAGRSADRWLNGCCSGACQGPGTCAGPAWHSHVDGLPACAGCPAQSPCRTRC